MTVDYAATAGTATAGVDFALTNGTLTFLPGETSKTFFVPIIDDLVVEPTETVNLTLRNPSGGAPLGGQNTSVLRIVDDDTTLEFSDAVFAANGCGTDGCPGAKCTYYSKASCCTSFRTYSPR